MTQTDEFALPLSMLVDPMSTEEFMVEFPRRFFVQHGPLDRIDAVASIPELRDVYAVAQVFNDPVSAWLPARATVDERKYGDLLRAPDALPYYERGALLQFNQVERWVPRLTAVLRGLELELGLPMRSATCSLFASTVGGEVFPHFDADPAFSLQLTGSKRWRVAAQDQISAPLHNHVCGSHRGSIGDYFEGELPLDMPDDSQVIEMQPGSILFLPRGYLHATQSHESSFALTFDLHIPHWAQVVASHLARLLTKKEAWRGHVLGARAIDDAHALGELSALMPELRAAIDELASHPREVLQSIDPPLLPGPRREYRRDTSVPVELGADQEEGHDVKWQIRVDHPTLGRADIEISPALTPLCQWLVSNETVFGDRDALFHAGDARPLDVSTVLSALLETGVLEALDLAAPQHVLPA